MPMKKQNQSVVLTSSVLNVCGQGSSAREKIYSHNTAAIPSPIAQPGSHERFSPHNTTTPRALCRMPFYAASSTKLRRTKRSPMRHKKERLLEIALCFAKQIFRTIKCRSWSEARGGHVHPQASGSFWSS